MNGTHSEARPEEVAGALPGAGWGGAVAHVYQTRRCGVSTIEGDKVRGQWTDPARAKLTVAAWADEWLTTKVDLRRSSASRLKGVLRCHMIPTFGAIALADVGNAAVRAWVADMTADGVGAATVRKSYNALAQMMRAAVADRRIAFDPCQDVPLPTEEYGEQRFLTPEEVATLADSIEPRYRAIVLLGAYGGLRFGECGALRRARVDLLGGRVSVAETLVDVDGQLSFGPPKTKKSRRTVPLPRRIVHELDQHMNSYVLPDSDALLFTGPKGGLLRRAGFGRLWWHPAVTAAGLEGLRFHDLRHTFVALWVDAGANPKEVSVRAGHSSVAFTLDRYGHLYEDREDRLSDRLDSLLEGARPARDAVVTRLKT